jgi:Holliday junction resolvase RusA-like endonuclease
MGRTPSGAPVVFTDRATRHFEAVVAFQAAQYIKRPLDGPIRLGMIIVLPRPKRLMRKKDHDGLVWAPKRPDRDNIEKAVTDGLKFCFRDDAQICAGESLKCYAEKKGIARIIISIQVMASAGPSIVNPEVFIEETLNAHPDLAGNYGNSEVAATLARAFSTDPKPDMLAALEEVERWYSNQKNITSAPWIYAVRDAIENHKK